MSHYRFEVPFRILNGNGDYMAAYAYYEDENNYLKIKVNRDNKTWEYEIFKNGVSDKQVFALPASFEFLDSHTLVTSYEEPWHTLTVYKNHGNFKVELDYFNLTINGQIQTDFSGSGRLGLVASSRNVAFDAIQYTNGWDEWDGNIAGWETKSGDWQTNESGLKQTQNQGKALAIKGDKNRDYEFSVCLKNDNILSSGKAGFYPLYVDENNYVEVGVNYATGKLEVIKNDNGQIETQSLPLSANISRQYTFQSHPTTSYRYDFRSETEVSGVNILWFEGNYPYLSQTFDLPDDVKFYALQNEQWTALNANLEGELRFVYLNTFTFDKVRTKAIKMEVTPKTGKAARAFSAYFKEELAANYYLRGRRENNKLYIFVNDSLKTSIEGNWSESNVGLFTDAATAGFNGMLCYQTGKVSVTKINIPTLSCAVNETIQLSAEVLPVNATNKHLVWESSNPEIASIDTNNRLTRHAEGSVTLTAWTADGGLIKATAVLETANGLNNPSAAGFYVSPNPTDDELHFHSSESVRKVEIYTPAGAKICEKKMDSPMGSLSVGFLNKGMYLLNAQTNNETLKVKFIKK
jgi:uncharacterized protein YjdB